ncbi:MAG: SMC-Scp complex subunit ScpB [Defluviitaleaceae bacterium]|nr:SMC-Scp complex subunit ScpB [Defluviitaleaceae bacterium]
MPNLTNEREKTIEAMLFASGESLHISRIAEALECDIPLTRVILDNIANTYEKENAGIQLREVDDSYRLCTNPAYYPAIQKLLNKKPRKALSQSMLEILAIIAYKQPVTRGVIESIRGVNCDHGVNRLMEWGLVVEMGRLDAPGRPILLGTSEEFLLFYGLRSIEDLQAVIFQQE